MEAFLISSCVAGKPSQLNLSVEEEAIAAFDSLGRLSEKKCLIPLFVFWIISISLLLQDSKANGM